MAVGQGLVVVFVDLLGMLVLLHLPALHPLLLLLPPRPARLRTLLLALGADAVMICCRDEARSRCLCHRPELESAALFAAIGVVSKVACLLLINVNRWKGSRD